MNYGSCDNCKKMIRYDRLRLCDECKNNFLHLVKDYIYENGVHTSKEISNATGVPVRVIDFFMNNDYFNSVNIAHIENNKNTSDEEKLKQMALLEGLSNLFNTSKESNMSNKSATEESLKGEMHFLGRKGK